MIGKIKKLLRKKWDNIFCDNNVKKLTLGIAGEKWTIVDNGVAEIVYSGGVGRDISFELDLVRNFNSKVYLFDPSPTGRLTFSKVDLNYKLTFYDCGLSKIDSYERFYAPKDILEGSYSIDASFGSSDIFEFRVRRLSGVAIENNHFCIDVLKLDIEGSEYGVLDDILESELLVRQICVEFHHFFKNGSRLRTLLTVLKMYRNDYRIVHKTGSEYTFYKI
jgi:FkbM family methyltransferase